jgi:hypothetical protein
LGGSQNSLAGLNARLCLFRGVTGRHVLGWYTALETKENSGPMGFVFYANYVRLILEGGFSLILLQRARTLMKTAVVRERIDS